MKGKNRLALLVSMLVLSSAFCREHFMPVEASTTHTVSPGQSIQEAIDSAQLGDTILVQAGKYYETLVVGKSLTLVGESREDTIVDGGGASQAVVTVAASDVVISSFTVQNSSRERASYSGIKVSGRGCRITDNYITKNRIGIFVTSQENVIDGNSVTKNGQGIALNSASETTVAENNVSANTVGISLASSSNNTIVGNRVTDSYTGGHGITLSSNSRNNTIRANVLIGNYHGIWLSSSPNNSILENTIKNNKLLGIELANSPDNTFYHNDFVNNGISPHAPRIKHIVIRDSPSTWDDGYPSGGNYWCDYEGVDLYSGLLQELSGSDGIGDTGYVITPNDIDRYPFVTPSISILSPWNKTYPITGIPLFFTVDRSALWIAYSLDNHANITLSGNTTLVGLSEGVHNITIYANNTYGYVGSYTVYFTMRPRQASPLWVSALAGLIVIVLIVGLFWKRSVWKKARRK